MTTEGFDLEKARDDLNMTRYIKITSEPVQTGYGIDHSQYPDLSAMQRVCAVHMPAAIVEIGRLRVDLEKERWQHAACLSIAEGALFWNKETWAESPAIQAVRNLRTQNLQQAARIEELEAHIPKIENCVVAAGMMDQTHRMQVKRLQKALIEDRCNILSHHPTVRLHPSQWQNQAIEELASEFPDIPGWEDLE